MSGDFVCWPASAAATHTCCHARQRFEIQSWQQRATALAADTTYFAFVQEGPVQLDCESGSFRLGTGMYFCVVGPATVTGGLGVLISQPVPNGLFQLGGPVESRGRLPYIDGCSDTLLISPVVRGEACLNLLYLPSWTRQTGHTHPSFRAGIVVSGRGRCVLPDREVPLVAGVVFCIPPDGWHAFHTDEQELRVIAFHPDSDFGPWHDDHPMVNRTIVEGVPASRLTPQQRRVDVSLP